MLSAGELRHFEGVLRDSLRSRIADLAVLTASLNDVRVARSDGTADDEHDPEGSTLSSDWSQISGLQSEAEQRIATIERALARIADGSYGNCMRCAQRISHARLEARPTAEYCIGCARQVESAR